jgi:hypothetical protein
VEDGLFVFCVGDGRGGGYDVGHGNFKCSRRKRGT